MGLAIYREQFAPEDYPKFRDRLAQSLEALRLLLERPSFGVGPRSIGAELELFLVDEERMPRHANREVLKATIDPRVTLELDRFNLELNARPLPLAGPSLATLHAELDDALAEVRRAAATQGCQLALIGMLPTLREADLLPRALTDLPRYRALAAAFRRLRQGMIEVHIEGPDPLHLRAEEVTLEGANTSFQLHLRVDPANFAAAHNAAELAIAPTLAASGNSPLFLGHRLWDETRIALFRQSLDLGAAPMPRRVYFGHGWVHKGAWEVFAESVARHQPLLPIPDEEEDPLMVVRAGGIPRLLELRLHHGTIYPWTRAVYDPTGHLRIEMRALPAGPTVIDMVASAAFQLGLTLALEPRMERLMPAMPFECAALNFERAARFGLDSELLWPSAQAPSPRPRSARALLRELLPLAREGLDAAGVMDAQEPLAIFAGRVESGQTGAVWQRKVLDRLGRDRLRELLDRYLDAAQSQKPVHEW